MLNDDNSNFVPFPDYGSIVVIARQKGAPDAEQSVIYDNNHATHEELRRAADLPLFEFCADHRPGSHLNFDLDQVLYYLSWAPV